jgi:hypothetical protein
MKKNVESSLEKQPFCNPKNNKCQFTIAEILNTTRKNTKIKKNSNYDDKKKLKFSAVNGKQGVRREIKIYFDISLKFSQTHCIVY